MRNRKIVFLAVLLALTGIMYAQTHVKVVMSEWPPFEYTEKGVFKGSDVEIMNAVFKEMGMVIDWEVYPWKRCEEMVKKNEADALVSLSKKPDREVWATYPKQPINISENVVFVRTGSAVTFKSFNDLKGLTLGITAGYTYGPEFDKNPLFTRKDQTMSLT